MSNDDVPRKKRGCVFYGCASLIVLALLLVVLFVAGFFVAKRTVNRWIVTYTDTTPQTIESVTFTPAEREELERRVAAFTEAVAAGKGGQELVLTAHELNVLIANNSELKGKLFVIIEDDKLRGMVSVPLKDIGPFKLNGRYLNGMATFKASLTNGVMDVSLEDILVKSNALPATVMSQFKNKNLAADYQKDPGVQQQMQNYESVRIQDGKVFLKSRETQPAAPAEPKAQ